MCPLAAELPELGVGVVYAPQLEPLLYAAEDLIDVIEIEPQPLWLTSPTSGVPGGLSAAAIKRFARFRQPKLVHGVGLPVGGTAPPEPRHVEAFLESVSLLAPPWVSEHLSFNRVMDGDKAYWTGFLLPPLQTDEGVAVAVANIRRVKAALPVPFAFETGVNYLRPLPWEMSDGAFFRAVAEEADCGILLDLHNLWANEENGRNTVRETVEQLPRERVWEIHLAGGQSFESYWLDAHSGLVPAPLMELAEDIVAQLPNLKAIVFEIMGDYVPAKNLDTQDLLNQLRQLRRLWERRSTSSHQTAASPKGPVSATSCFADHDSPSPHEWERTLGGLANHRPADSPLASRIEQDPGISVFRHLVSTVRGGMTFTALTLTCRLLMMKLGTARFDELLQRFWESTPPGLFATEEAQNFGAFLRSRNLNIPHLLEVLDYELASQQVLVEGSPRVVRFTCEPMPLLTALGEGQLPQYESSGDFELTIEPHSSGKS